MKKLTVILAIIALGAMSQACREDQTLTEVEETVTVNDLISATDDEEEEKGELD